MEITRRIFLGAAAVFLAPAFAARRCVEAVRGLVYPGPVRPLNDEQVKRPGKWAG